MQTDFTPWTSLAGGALIGLAAILMMALHGRILGATGILAGVFRFRDPADWALRVAVIAGMATGPFLYMIATGSMPAVDLPIPDWMIVVGGVIVGIGTSYGGGCTSGHGVCGIARFSRRSFVATAVFMTTAIITVYIIRHVVGV